MINANELRIGNLVNEESSVLTGSYILQKIESINNKENYIDVETPTGSIKKTRLYYCHPIPLTPEILESCGWVNENVPDRAYFIRKELPNFEVSLHPNGFMNFFDIPLQNGVMFLHQLQNFYFVWTGEELKINLNVEAANR